MDLKSFVDTFDSCACIVSVELCGDGTRGDIRVEEGNTQFYDSLKRIGKDFRAGCLYTDVLSKDLSFEDFCYRCAVLKRPLHSYVDWRELGFWVNTFMLPVASDKENTAYCVYVYEASRTPDFDKLTDISMVTSAYVLKTMIKLSDGNNYQESMDSIIKDIRALCNANRCCITLTDFTAQTCSVLCEDHAPGVPDLDIPQFSGAAFYPVVKTWPATVAGSNGVIAKDRNEIEKIRYRNPVWFDSLTSKGVKSVILFPLKTDKETIGFIWATNFEVEDAVTIKEVLELTAFLIAPKIANHELMCRLREMSMTDILTGLKNRNAMNTVLDTMDASKPYGVIYADINGLKRTNDSLGHAAGDKLLREAAAVLREAFPDTDVLRTGGDEFVVILRDISKEDFYARLESIKGKSQTHPSVDFAAGGFYDDEIHNLGAAMQKADERMYADKAEFYKKSGI